MQYAHARKGEPRELWEPLIDHLQLTAEGNHLFPGAAGFAKQFGAEEIGRLLGLWHDLGKYSAEWQQYFKDAVEAKASDKTTGKKLDHATAGAQHAASRCEILGKLLAFCIAGHHGGLLDQIDEDGNAGLENRLVKEIPDWSAAPNEVLDRATPSFPQLDFDRGTDLPLAFQISFLCRMLFSCLVDADFLATEHFMDEQRCEARFLPTPDVSELKMQLDEHLAALPKNASTSVNEARANVLAACREAALEQPGLFSLTVPTGGGKTLSSMAFALDHANTHDLRRVIYAIPFTSIIEQNADVFRNVFRASSNAVLEHHSSLDPKEDTPWSRLASENWDAPIVVTTNVQFFESLFASRTSRCRKLHRIVGSVIILDEVQTLPVELLKPTLEALKELARNYRCTIVLCSATQPAIARSSEFEDGLEGIREIYPDVPALFEDLRRVEIEQVGKLDHDELADKIVSHRQALVVVDTRRHAADLFKLISDRIDNANVFHLSAQMCPQHRTDRLAEINECLDNDKPCIVVSTQVVEAGVDIDFPVVYRSISGTDSIAQAAGRCNRRGLLDRGSVYIFEPKGKLPSHVSRRAHTFSEISSNHDDLLSPEAVNDYFGIYYWKRGSELDKKDVLKCFANYGKLLQFRKASERYRLIENDQTPVIVPYGNEGRALIEELRNSHYPPGWQFNRRAQRYLVNVRAKQLKHLTENCAIETFHECFVALIRDEGYDLNLGLTEEGVAMTTEDWIQ